VQVDNLMKLREKLNKSSKSKLSVNNFFIKASSLTALKVPATIVHGWIILLGNFYNMILFEKFIFWASNMISSKKWFTTMSITDSVFLQAKNLCVMKLTQLIYKIWKKNFLT